MPNAVDPTGLEELQIEVLDFGQPIARNPKVQYDGEIMFPELARWHGIPGSDDTDTYYRPNAKGNKVGTWVVTPYFALDPEGNEYVRYYLALTQLYDHPAGKPRLRAAWIIPPNRVTEFATGDRSKYEYLETVAYGTSDHLTPGQVETFASGSILPLAKEELKRQWTDPVLVTQCIAGTMMALPARTPSGVVARGPAGAFEFVDETVSARQKYSAIRQWDDRAVQSISTNTGTPMSYVRGVHDHLFLQEHRLAMGPQQTVRSHFIAYDEIADLWNRAKSGRLSAADKAQWDLLIAHEYVERALMKSGMPYRSADVRAWRWMDCDVNGTIVLSKRSWCT